MLVCRKGRALLRQRRWPQSSAPTRRDLVQPVPKRKALPKPEDSSLGTFLTRHSDFCIHGANLFAVAAMLQTDMLQLRSLSVCGTTLFITYYLTQQPKLLTAACWGCVFLVGHGMMIAELLNSRRSVEMSQLEIDLYERCFHEHGFRPRQFLRLLREGGGHWREVKVGDVLSRAGEPAQHVCVLHTAKAEVQDSNGELVGLLEPGHFAGRLWRTDHKEEWNNAMTLRVCESGKVLEWPRHKLHSVVASCPELRNAAASVVASDLRTKISDLNKLHSQTLHLESYKDMLKVALAPHRVTPEQKRTLREFREAHHVGVAAHEEFLTELGWSTQEFDDGFVHEWSAAAAIGAVALVEEQLTTAVGLGSSDAPAGSTQPR